MPLAGEGGHELAVVRLGVLDHELLARREAAREDVARVEAAGRRHRDTRGDAALETGDADHEELVEVAREDRREAYALQQRQRVVLRQLEDPGVEGDP